MGNTAKIMALFTVIIAITTSCKKKETTVPEENPQATAQQTANTGNKVKALFNNLATSLQSYTINANTYNTFTCANGTKIITYPNSFLTLLGEPATGVITIKVKDILSKKDMILNNAIPVSNGQLLVSGGEIYLSAAQGEQKLIINPQSYLFYMIPARNTHTSQMLNFYSSGGYDLSATSLNWITNNESIPLSNDTSNGSSSWFYVFRNDSVGWNNCDYFYNIQGEKTTCTINTSGSFNNTNTVIFLSINSVNSIARLSSSETAISQQYQSYQNSIPINVNYTLIAISFDGTNYYYSSQQVTMAPNMIITIPPLTQTTKNQIQINLGTLP